MKDFQKNPPSINELMVWKRNQTKNPRNGKSLVLKNGKFNGAHGILEARYKEIFSFDYDFLDSTDERDPVSLVKFYNIKKNGKKEFIYDNYKNLILYEEIDDTRNVDTTYCVDKPLIRCFEKESLSYLKLYGIKKHPVSQIEIPSHVFDKVSKAKLNKSELTIKDRALEVFQILTNISIFIDHKLYINLTKEELIKLNYEIKDFYEQNLSDEDRNLIESNIEYSDEDTDSQSESISNKLFSISSNTLKEKNLEFIQFYILDQIESLINCKIDHLKYMVNYIVLAGLSLVIDEVKELYENFAFNFSN